MVRDLPQTQDLSLIILCLGFDLDRVLRTDNVEVRWQCLNQCWIYPTIRTRLKLKNSAFNNLISILYGFITWVNSFERRIRLIVMDPWKRMEEKQKLFPLLSPLSRVLFFREDISFTRFRQHRAFTLFCLLL